MMMEIKAHEVEVANSRTPLAYQAVAVRHLVRHSQIVEGRLTGPTRTSRFERSRMGDIINLTLLVERIGRSSLGIAIVCHQNGIERLCARIVTAMMSLEARKAVPLPQALRDAIESYRQRTTDGEPP
jgi:acyl-CoA thioesterase FadM